MIIDCDLEGCLELWQCEMLRLRVEHADQQNICEPKHLIRQFFMFLSVVDLIVLDPDESACGPKCAVNLRKRYVIGVGKVRRKVFLTLCHGDEIEFGPARL